MAGEDFRTAEFRTAKVNIEGFASLLTSKIYTLKSFPFPLQQNQNRIK